MKKIQQGINFAYPTPIALTNIAEESVNRYDLLNAIYGHELTKPIEKAYKAESINDLQNIDREEIKVLCSIVLSHAQLFVESIVGHSVDQQVKINSGLLDKSYNSRRVKNLNPQLVISDSWCNCYKQGDYHPPHNHPSVDIVAVYFFDLSSCEGGELAFLDPRNVNYYSSPIAFSEEGLSFSHRPIDGDLLLFPGWLHHFVTPVKAGLRRSISFNVSVLI